MTNIDNNWHKLTRIDKNSQANILTQKDFLFLWNFAEFAGKKLGTRPQKNRNTHHDERGLLEKSSQNSTPLYKINW